MGGTCLRNKEMSKEDGNKVGIDRISVFLVRIHQYHNIIMIIACVLGNEGSQATDMMSWSEGTFQGTFTDGLWPGKFCGCSHQSPEEEPTGAAKTFQTNSIQSPSKKRT